MADVETAVVFLGHYTKMMNHEVFFTKTQKDRYTMVARQHYHVEHFRDMPAGVKTFISYCANIAKTNRSTPLFLISRQLSELYRKASEVLYLQLMKELDGHYIKYVLPQQWQETMEERVALWYKEAEKNPHMIPPQSSL